MIVPVPRTPIGGVARSVVASGEPVSSSTWNATRDVVAYLIARGGQLVCSNRVIGNNPTALRYYTWPRAVAHKRVWLLSIYGVCDVEISDGASATRRIRRRTVNAAPTPWHQGTATVAPVIYVADAAASDTPGEIVLDIAPTVGDGYYIADVCCFEMPRASLEIGAGEDAISEVSQGSAIYEANEKSLYGLGQAIEAGRSKITRANLHWYYPAGFSTTNTSFQSVFPIGLKILGQAGSAADGTTITLAWAALITATTQNAQARLTMASGASSTVTQTAGTSGWVTGTIVVDREDLSDDDSGGQPSRLFGDGAAFELRTVAGGGTAALFGLGVGRPG